MTKTHNNDDKGQGFYVTEHSGITCLLDWVSQWLSYHPKPHTELLQVSGQNLWCCHCVLDIFLQLLNLLYHWGKVSQTLTVSWCHPVPLFEGTCHCLAHRMTFSRIPPHNGNTAKLTLRACLLTMELQLLPVMQANTTSSNQSSPISKILWCWFFLSWK